MQVSVCFRLGVSAVKVKIVQMDKTGESEIKMIARLKLLLLMMIFNVYQFYINI